MELSNLERKLESLRAFMDIEGLRKGLYTDKYFINIQKILAGLEKQTYKSINQPLQHSSYDVSTAEVEMQVFTRRPGAVVCGIDFALACLKFCSGKWEDGNFIETSSDLEVWAVEDGEIIPYSGDPAYVTPVIKIHGRYKDFALNETLMLGYLSRASRIATNVYELLQAANGKPLLFFPARYDIPEVQFLDGYAYRTAIHVYNQNNHVELQPFISTDAQGLLFDRKGGGTIPHAAIACFLGDTVKTTLAFAHIIPPEVHRVALVDFDNDCVNTSVAVAKELFSHYSRLIHSKPSEAEKYKLFGVRLDTSAALRDVSVPNTGNPKDDHGVNPTLVRLVREGLDSAWKTWELSPDEALLAKDYCDSIKIVVSGGFNKNKIQRFEEENVPVDIYAVGSAAFDNHGPTVTDFTADVVRVKLDGNWVDMAKVGRQANQNPKLKRVW